jgi:2-polyprenyl-6-methoxyphenol hydroxylase-like FAD-dependent oxidoreductase
MHNVAIVGTGLIGASFGLALRGAGFDGTITGVSSERALAAAFEAGAIDRAAPLADAVAEADLVFLSQTPAVPSAKLWTWRGNPWSDASFSVAIPWPGRRSAGPRPPKPGCFAAAHGR